MYIIYKQTAYIYNHCLRLKSSDSGSAQKSKHSDDSHLKTRTYNFSLELQVGQTPVKNSTTSMT